MGSKQDSETSAMVALAAELQAHVEADIAKSVVADPVQTNDPTREDLVSESNSLQRIFTIIKQHLHTSLTSLKRFGNEPPTVSIVILAFSKIEYTMRCLESLSRQASHHTFEVILIDNNSSDMTPNLVGGVPGLRYFRNSTNRGFVDGCNDGVRHARGKIVVLLNNDTQVLGGWLDALVDRLTSDSGIGLVGSKLVYPDGRLQEAGGIIFSDASGYNFGKYQQADDFEYNYCREVDYCSGASIAFWRKDFTRLGSFDRRYTPAYYEDTDLAMSMRHKLGKRAIYEPHSILVHIEGGTAGTNTTSGFKHYQVINRDKFYKKWQKELTREHYPPGTNSLIAARHGKRKRVLVVDSIVPEHTRDSGSLRMFQILKTLLKLNYDVTLYAHNRVATQPYTGELQSLGVEVVYGKGQTLQDFYQQRAGMYNTIILSRPTTAIWHLEYCKAYQPKAHLMYDTVDLHYVRIGRQAEIEHKSSLKNEAEKWRQLEHYLMDHTDATLVVSHEEQKLLQKAKPTTVVRILSNINAPLSDSAKPLEFKKRSGLLFIGSSHTPNQDAVLWFCRHILPLVRREIPSVEITLLGSNPSPVVSKLANDYIHIPGFIEDVSPYFCKAKVFVCPMRFGAGVKGKVSQSLAFRLPVVSTAVGTEGMHLEDGKSCLQAETPEEFARQVVRVYNDSKLWDKLSRNSQAIYDQYFSEAAGIKALRNALRS